MVDPRNIAMSTLVKQSARRIASQHGACALAFAEQRLQDAGHAGDRDEIQLWKAIIERLAR
jgi:hypothetical protein